MFFLFFFGGSLGASQELISETIAADMGGSKMRGVAEIAAASSASGCPWGADGRRRFLRIGRRLWRCLGPLLGCCWETFYIFAYCGLVVKIPTWLLKLFGLLPFLSTSAKIMLTVSGVYQSQKTWAFSLQPTTCKVTFILIK